MLRESHTLAQIRRFAQFLFVHRSVIGNFEAFVVTGPDEEAWTRTQAGTVRLF